MDPLVAFIVIQLSSTQRCLPTHRQCSYQYWVTRLITDDPCRISESLVKVIKGKLGSISFSDQTLQYLLVINDINHYYSNGNWCYHSKCTISYKKNPNPMAQYPCYFTFHPSLSFAWSPKRSFQRRYRSLFSYTSNCFNSRFPPFHVVCKTFFIQPCTAKFDRARSLPPYLYKTNVPGIPPTLRPARTLTPL